MKEAMITNQEQKPAAYIWNKLSTGRNRRFDAMLRERYKSLVNLAVARLLLFYF
jgi:hypothetical protein